MNRNLPSAGPVAQVALRAIFATMNVGMAVLAIAAHIREYRIHMALLACHHCVQPA
ncbi:MAG TPA: hypothetical protein VMX38_10855 [Verrucomicrobiae bacterium]|nr:hypothetical protein [Verrucomicrobiae bacterium]